MTIRHPVRLLLAGLGLGWAFDLLFWGKTPGISILIYAILLLAGLALTLRWQRVQPMPVNLWMPVLVLVFAAWAFIRANAFLIFLNVAAVLALLVLISANLVRNATLGLRVRDLLLAPLEAMVYSLSGAVFLLGESRRAIRRDLGEKPTRNLPAVMIGLLISLPLLLVLIPLLMSADMVFADMMRSIFVLDAIIERSVRLLFMGLLGLVVGGAWVYTAQTRTPAPAIAETPSSSAAKAPQSHRLGPIEVLIPLILTNLLFLIFIIIQIAYLFGGVANITEHGYTYAEYARRGFAELVIAALIIFGVILVLRSLGRLESPRARRAFNLAATLLLTLTIILLLSAFKRLALYESAYGFTLMRLLPHVFMVWLGALLLWFIITLWIAPGRLAIGILTAAFGFILTLNLLNPDAFIVRQNVARFRAHGKLADFMNSRSVDVYYFQTLSEDAVPALLEELPNLRGARPAVEEDLRRRYQRMQEDDAWRAWQSWNLSRWRAYHLLQTHFEESPTVSELAPLPIKTFASPTDAGS